MEAYLRVLRSPFGHVDTRTQRVLEEVVNALNALSAPTESDAWKELGNRFFDSAKEARENSEAFTYCLFGGVCLGRSVDLARAKNVAAGGQH